MMQESPIGIEGRPHPMTRGACLVIVLLSAVLLSSCASYTQITQDIRQDFRGGRYEKALADLEKSEIKEQSRNRLLYLMEKAMILDRLERRAESRKVLIEADKLADDLYTVSVTKTAASFIVNDSQSDYSGEDHEKVAIHTMLALSFLRDGDLKAARVEANKINNKLYEINQSYGESSKNHYSEDAFARYMAAMIYESLGDWDDAIIDYSKALSLYAGSYREFYRAPTPPVELVEALARLLVKRGRRDRLDELAKTYPDPVKKARDEGPESNKGDIIIIHELGHIAIKTTQEFFLPISGQVIRFSFPIIRKSSGLWGGETGIEVDGKGSNTGTNVQDMDAIASRTLEDRRLRMIAKQGARLIAKGVLTDQAYKNFGPLGGIAANAFSAITETADTRSWTLLPSQFVVSRMRLPPGEYNIRIKSDGRLTQMPKASVKAGQAVLIRDVL